MKAIDVNHKIVSSEGEPTCRSKRPKIDRWQPPARDDFLVAGRVDLGALSRL